MDERTELVKARCRCGEIVTGTRYAPSNATHRKSGGRNGRTQYCRNLLIPAPEEGTAILEPVPNGISTTAYLELRMKAWRQDWALVPAREACG